MSWKNINFENKELKKRDFYKNKKTNQIGDIDFNNILISKKDAHGTKNSFTYFIGYNDNDIIRPLCIKIPQMAGYFRKFNENSTMSFRVMDKQLWKKVENLLNIDFQKKSVDGDDDKYIKTKEKYLQKIQLQIFIIKKCLKKKYHANVYQ